MQGTHTVCVFESHKGMDINYRKGRGLFSTAFAGKMVAMDWRILRLSVVIFMLASTFPRVLHP